MPGTNSITTSDVQRLYGGMPSGDQQNIAQGMAEPRQQYVAEVLVPGTVHRVTRGPKKNGHYSLQVFVDSAGGAASVATVWYSNVPDPTIGTDADWVQDATIGSIDLTSTTPKMFQIGNVYPSWIKLKMVVAVSNASVRAFIRTEGGTVSGL